MASISAIQVGTTTYSLESLLLFYGGYEDNGKNSTIPLPVALGMVAFIVAAPGNTQISFTAAPMAMCTYKSAGFDLYLLVGKGTTSSQIVYATFTATVTTHVQTGFLYAKATT